MTKPLPFIIEHYDKRHHLLARHGFIVLFIGSDQLYSSSKCRILGAPNAPQAEGIKRFWALSKPEKVHQKYRIQTNVAKYQLVTNQNRSWVEHVVAFFKYENVGSN